MGWFHYLVAVSICLVCVVLIGIILLQKGRGGGLSAAFGGGGSGSAFGAKTGDVFTWITVALAVLYLFLNIVGSYTFRQVVTPAGPATIGTSAPQTPGTPQPGDPASPAPDDGAVPDDGGVESEDDAGAAPDQP